MFLPGASLKTKLLGIAVLAILTASMIGFTLAAVNRAVAEGNSLTQSSREEASGIAGSQGPASGEPPVVRGLKFVCPFH
jgi:hypothetical protein